MTDFVDVDHHKADRADVRRYDVPTIGPNNLLGHDAPRAIDYLSIEAEGVGIHCTQCF